MFAIIFVYLISNFSTQALAQEGQFVELDRATIHDLIVRAHNEGPLTIDAYFPDPKVVAREKAAAAEEARFRGLHERAEASARAFDDSVLRANQRPSLLMRFLEGEEGARARSEAIARVHDRQEARVFQRMRDAQFESMVYDNEAPMVSSDEVGTRKSITIPKNPTRAEAKLLGLSARNVKVFLKGGVLSGAAALGATAALVPAETMATERAGDLQVDDVAPIYGVAD